VDAGLARAAKPIAEELALALAQDALAGPPVAPNSGAPVTEIGRMIDGREGEEALPSDPKEPHDPINAKRFAYHAAIELQAGASHEDARTQAFATMGEHDVASAAIILPTPPAMEATILAAHIRRLIGALQASGVSAPADKLDTAA
jgi:hypothetical protein